MNSTEYVLGLRIRDSINGAVHAGSTTVKPFQECNDFDIFVGVTRWALYKSNVDAVLISIGKKLEKQEAPAVQTLYADPDSIERQIVETYRVDKVNIIVCSDHMEVANRIAANFIVNNMHDHKERDARVRTHQAARKVIAMLLDCIISPQDVLDDYVAFSS